MPNTEYRFQNPPANMTYPVRVTLDPKKLGILAQMDEIWARNPDPKIDLALTQAEFHQLEPNTDIRDALYKQVEWSPEVMVTSDAQEGY